MPYNPKTWKYDDLATEADLNRIEQGVAQATTTAKAAETPAGAQAKVNAHANNKNNPHSVTAAQVGAIPATNGAVTDSHIGDRTVSDTVAPTGNTGVLGALLNWLAYMIRVITGEGTWRTAPATTLKAAKTHMDGTAEHGATSAATANRIILRDGSGRAKVGAPAAADDIARKDTVDAHASDTASGIHGSTSAATASTLMHRDSAGRSKIAAPAAADDIARKDTVDAVQGNLNTHAAATTAGIHGSATAATANTLMHRDSSGRSKVAAPAAADDIARKDTVDAVQASINTHVGATAIGTHGSTAAATAGTLMHRDASGRAKVAAPAAADDIAIRQTVDDHANLTAPHSATAAATASRLMLRDAAGRSKVAAPAAADDIARKDTVDTAVAGRIAKGAANTDVEQVYALLLGVHTRATEVTWDAQRRLSQIREYSGATTVRTTTLTYDTNGRVSQVQEVSGGKTITTTVTYDAGGSLSGMTRSVV